MSADGLGKHADFRSLIDHLDGIVVWTTTQLDGVDYLSDGFEEIWGIPPEAAEEDIDKFLERVHPDDRKKLYSVTDEFRQGISKASVELRAVRPDGTERWVLMRMVALRNDAGDMTEMIGVTTDITEQKHREEELAVLNRVVRHDIRNDMAIVLGWAELLDEHVDDEGREYLRKILASGEHIVELTDITRDYVETIGSDDAALIHPMPLRSVFDTEITLRRESYPEAEFEIQGEIPDVDVSANGMLSSVFRNLLNNAVHHNDTETPTVTITFEERDEDVVVRIADNGPGIPDAQKEAVFDRGEKGLASPGTGIGLHLVRKLVTQYDGDLRVEDNDPTGAVFTVTLPRAN